MRITKTPLVPLKPTLKKIPDEDPLRLYIDRFQKWADATEYQLFYRNVSHKSLTRLFYLLFYRRRPDEISYINSIFFFLFFFLFWTTTKSKNRVARNERNL